MIETVQNTGGKMLYHRVCYKLEDKGKLVPETYDWNKLIKEETYVSVFKYNQNHFDEFKKTNTISGITDVTTNLIYFDFDNKNDVEVARKDAIDTYKKLVQLGITEASIDISFSGNKGFHLAIHTTDEYTPSQVKAFASSIAMDSSSFDDSIYNPSRVIRINGSTNPNSKLFKIQLTKEELQSLSLDDIKKLAASSYEYNKPKKSKLPVQAEALMSEKSKKVNKEIKTLIEDQDKYKVDYSSNPYKLFPRKLAIAQGIFPEGQRSNALLILATTLKFKNMDKTHCYYALKAAADLQSEKFGTDKFDKKEIWKNIINQVYGENWQGKTYAENNFPHQLKEFFEEHGIPEADFKEVAGDVVGIEDKFDDFIKYAQDIEKYTMRTGISALDKALKIRKGHMIGLIAPPSVGKTSFAVSLLNNTSKEGIKSYFGSYDMFSLNVYQKLIQRHTGLSEDQMYEVFKNKDLDKINNFRKVLSDNYKNVAFCFKSGQSVDEIKASIKLEEEKSGKTVELVVIDYLELVRTDKSDPTVSSAEAIQGLREIANEGKVVLVLLQPNKLSSKINEPMTSYNSAKGSSSIAQACTAILGCWREGMSPENPENDRFFSINVLKNRNGALASLDFGWDGSTQTIYELDNDGKFQLKVLRDTKKEAKEDDKYGGI